MANVRTIRRRIRSVQSTAKITKAMQMIAASKMRFAQLATLAGRPYAEKIEHVLSDLAAQPIEGEEIHPFFIERDITNTAVIHMTPDRGLCGGLPGNLNRSCGDFILGESSTINSVAVGKKGRDFLIRTGNQPMAVFTDLPDKSTVEDIMPIAKLVIDGYMDGSIDKVVLSYPQFINVTLQTPIIKQLLPVIPSELSSNETVGYIYEPSSIDLMELLLPRYIETEIYHALLESRACEHSSRMVAMRNATDSANDMIDSLTLLMNKVRQEAITTELLDIVGGVAALN